MRERSLLFICDGPRESDTVPTLVQKCVPESICGRFLSWHDRRLNRPSGFAKKLRFIMAEARADGLDGVVATLDRDKAKQRERLGKLIEERERDRSDPAKVPLPVAVGEANPHAEAWFLDDEKAVRAALNFPTDRELPNVVKCIDPKQVLNELCEEAGVSALDVLASLAESLEESRCNHAKETGLKEFLADVRAEFTNLIG